MLATRDAEELHVPLLVLVFSQRSNVARREEQRRSWLSFGWHRGPSDAAAVPWRHLYVYGRSAAPRDSRGGRTVLYDQVVGDGVTLSRVGESYSGLVYKTMEAVRWALASVSFEVLLKTDDDSVVHVGRMWHWLQASFSADERETLYAGRVINGSQVVRPGFTRKHLWYPDWYPRDFKRWAVAHEAFGPEVFPPYCSGGGYVVGRTAASRILRAYDRRPAAHVFPLEDAFVGVLAAEAAVPARQMPGVTDLLLDAKHRQRWDDATGSRWFAGKLLVHRVAQPRRALRWLLLERPLDGRPVQVDSDTAPASTEALVGGKLVAIVVAPIAAVLVIVIVVVVCCCRKKKEEKARATGCSADARSLSLF